MAASTAVRALQFTASAVMGRMEKKAKYAGVPPRQQVPSTSIFLWHVKSLWPGAGLQLLGFSIELGYMPCWDLWGTGPGKRVDTESQKDASLALNLNKW